MPCSISKSDCVQANRVDAANIATTCLKSNIFFIYLDFKVNNESYIELTLIYVEKEREHKAK